MDETYNFGVVKNLEVLGLGPFKYLGHTVELGFLPVSHGRVSWIRGDTYDSLKTVGKTNGIVESSLGSVSGVSRRNWLQLVYSSALSRCS